MKRSLATIAACVLALFARTALAQDRVVLSFAKDEIVTSRDPAEGDAVTIYLLAILSDPSRGVTGFSCGVGWRDGTFRDLEWQAPVRDSGDGALDATFVEARFQVAGYTVLATASARAAARDCAAMWLVGTPVIVGTTDVTLSGNDGEPLGLGCPEDPGPPGAPSVVRIKEKAPPLLSDGAR